MTPEYQPPLGPAQTQKSRALPWVIGCCAALLLGAIVVGVGGYAFYRLRYARATNKNTNGASPGVGTPNRNQPETSASPANSNQSPVREGTRTAWEATAQSLIGDAGTTSTLVCSAGGSLHSVWGSDVYTADSSICTAAVHAGLITVERGGTVTIELRPGREVYGASERNGVTTSAYGGFGRSFVFKSETNSTAETELDDVTPILWNTGASMLTYENGKRYKFKCPAGGKESTIWGTDVYTADSSVCTAAVHVGVIKFEDGGPVTIELGPGQSSYQGTLRNSVKSSDYGAYAHSFVVK